jgi:hypothetical protein
METRTWRLAVPSAERVRRRVVLVVMMIVMMTAGGDACGKDDDGWGGGLMSIPVSPGKEGLGWGPSVGFRNTYPLEPFHQSRGGISQIAH